MHFFLLSFEDRMILDKKVRQSEILNINRIEPETVDFEFPSRSYRLSRFTCAYKITRGNFDLSTLQLLKDENLVLKSVRKIPKNFLKLILKNEIIQKKIKPLSEIFKEQNPKKENHLTFIFFKI